MAQKKYVLRMCAFLLYIAARPSIRRSKNLSIRQGSPPPSPRRMINAHAAADDKT